MGQFEVDAKRSEYERAFAAFELELEKQAQLHTAQQKVNSMSLFAPLEGTVTHIYPKVGDVLGPSEDAIALANIDSTIGTFRAVSEPDNRAFQYPGGCEVYFIDQAKSPARDSLKN